jgi:hypothetical protein
MEAIIQFFENYWGYTLFGGVTLGTLITFSVLMIRQLLASSKSKGLFESFQKSLTKLMEDGKEVKERARLEIEKEKEKNAYLEQVIAASFEAISYLTMSSKLPIDEKIRLQNKFNEIVVKPAVKDVKEDIVPDTVPEIEEVVTTAVARTKTLLDSFLDKE